MNWNELQAMISEMTPKDREKEVLVLIKALGDDFWLEGKEFAYNPKSKLEDSSYYIKTDLKLNPHA